MFNPREGVKGRKVRDQNSPEEENVILSRDLYLCPQSYTVCLSISAS